MNIPVESCQRSLEEEINYLSLGKNYLRPMTRDAEDVKVWTVCQSGTFSTKTLFVKPTDLEFYLDKIVIKLVSKGRI